MSKIQNHFEDLLEGYNYILHPIKSEKQVAALACAHCE